MGIKKWWMLLLPCVILLSACRISQTDYYAILIQACPKPVPNALGQLIIPAGCQKALEQMLPFDSTFDHASADKKQSIVEAFFRLLYVPLHYPHNKQILLQGSSTIPQAYFCLLTPELDPSGCEQPELQGETPNPNRALVNYILNSISTFSYAKSGTSSLRLAEYQASPFGEVVIYDAFWDKFSKDAWYIYIAVLAHESRHGHGTWHIDCSDGRGFTCDSDFSGAYGLEAVVSEMLLHGIDEESPHSLSDSSMQELSQHICTRLAHIFSASEQFRTQIDINYCLHLPLSFFVQAEQLVSIPTVPVPPKTPQDPTASS